MRTPSLLALPTMILALTLPAAVHAAEIEVEVTDTSFNPAEVVIRPGDTVVWRNTGGHHNVMADDASFRSGDATSSRFVYRHTFATPGLHRYFCEAHGGAGGIGMAGRVVVAGETPFVINEGVQGSWLHPGHASQGFFVDVAPSLGLVGLAWFTWTPTTGGHDWLTATGPFADGMATLTFQRHAGGRFMADAPTTSAVVGTGTLAFTDCVHAELRYTLTDPPATGTLSLLRLLPASAQCIAANP